MDGSTLLGCSSSLPVSCRGSREFGDEGRHGTPGSVSSGSGEGGSVEGEDDGDEDGDDGVAAAAVAVVVASAVASSLAGVVVEAVEVIESADSVQSVPIKGCSSSSRHFNSGWADLSSL